MSDVVISVEGLGKRYRIAHQRDGYGRLTESLQNAILAPVDRLRGARPQTSEWIWALRDVSFEVHRGDVVGVIGRNGAGKTTLLKVLSRITEPTTGRALLHGRVGSLLEVGTGFHPELTGRENIYLSGSILGMRRREIARRFDEIVAFSGVEQFLDTPVKRYSSGMQVRLGFAVAAHLETEILLVDEVLAVGDADFQKKCIGKMEQIGDEGRAIVFVSHSMPSVLRLCRQALLLEDGRVATAGRTHEVLRAYLGTNTAMRGRRTWAADNAPGDTVARLRSVEVLARQNEPSTEEIDIRAPLEITVEYWSEDPGRLRPSVILWFYNDEGVCLFANHDWNDRRWWEQPRHPGMVRATCHIPGNFLAEGRITITAGVITYNPRVVHAIAPDAITFQIVDRTQGDGVRGVWAGQYGGLIRPMLQWRAEMVPDQPTGVAGDGSRASVASSDPSPEPGAPTGYEEWPRGSVEHSPSVAVDQTD